MTDLELTKLCAEAMRLDHKVVGGSVLLRFVNAINDPRLAGVEYLEKYDPLHDDAQALQLVRAFGVTVDPAQDEPPFTWRAVLPPWDEDEIENSIHADGLDLNRAIVETVAKMQAKRSEHGPR